MSAFLRWSEVLTGRRCCLWPVSLRLPRPFYGSYYAQIFGSEISFSSSRNCLHLPLEFLQWPILNSDQYLREVIAQRALRLWQPLQGEDEWLVKVRELIRDNLRDGVSAQQVCQVLHISRPTLYRHLKQRGSSFTDLLNAVRKDLAVERIARWPLSAKIWTLTMSARFTGRTDAGLIGRPF